MSADAQAVENARIEREITERLAAARIHLRFDRSALRLASGLKSSLVEAVPKGQAVIFTISAPIRRRTKTAIALENLVRDGLPDRDVRITIQDNHVGLRRVSDVPAHKAKVLVFVHNPESDAGFILALAESQLLGRN